MRACILVWLVHQRNARNQETFSLSRLINLSIQSGYFPTKWKMARVTLLFKHGAQDCQENFRPISVLSILSKVCEKHVAASFMDYLVNTGLLCELQSAFRAGHSTESALISLTDQILFNLDEDKLSGMVFVDLRKAFDVLIINCFLRNCACIEWVTLRCHGLNHIFLVANSLSVLTVKDQTLYLSSKGYRKEVS